MEGGGEKLHLRGLREGIQEQISPGQPSEDPSRPEEVPLHLPWVHEELQRSTAAACPLPHPCIIYYLIEAWHPPFLMPVSGVLENVQREGELEDAHPLSHRSPPLCLLAPRMRRKVPHPRPFEWSPQAPRQGEGDEAPQPDQFAQGVQPTRDSLFKQRPLHSRNSILTVHNMAASDQQERRGELQPLEPEQAKRNSKYTLDQNCTGELRLLERVSFNLTYCQFEF